MEIHFEACKAKGDPTTALQVFESRVKVADCRGTFRLSAVLDLYDITNDFAGAKNIFEAIVGAEDNGGVRGWIGLLRVTARDSDFDAIVERMESLVNDGMELSREVVYELMNSYYARGEYDTMIAKLTKIAHRLPLLPWPWHVLGEAYTLVRNHDKTIKVYESTIHRHLDDIPLYQRLANVHLTTFNYHRVMECYEIMQEMCDEPQLLAVYASGAGYIDDVPIDERFREHLLWYPISEAHKREGEHYKAQQIYDSAIDLYQTAIDYKYMSYLRCIYFPRKLGASGNCVGGDWGFASLPEDILLCEVYKAKQDVKPALEAFQKAYTLLRDNCYLKNVIAELKQKLYETGDDNK